MKNQREATPAEILANERSSLRYDNKVRYRHFVREICDYRTKNGVRHKQYGRSKLRVIDGIPHVKHHGEIVPVTATYVELELIALGGYPTRKAMILDLRLKSNYLPSLV